MSINEIEEEIVRQLREQIEVLELDREHANHRIEELERALESTDTQRDSSRGSLQERSQTREVARSNARYRECKKSATGPVHTKERCTTIVREDRWGNPLKVGDKIYIKTKGSNPERYGTIKEFDRKWVIIRDRTNRQQRRIPRNVELRDW